LSTPLGVQKIPRFSQTDRIVHMKAEQSRTCFSSPFPIKAYLYVPP